MTTEKAIEFGKNFLKTIEDEKGSATYEFVETAVKMMEQEPVLDKIREEIMAIGNWTTKGELPNEYLVKVLEIIDKYRTDRSDDYD